MSEEWRMSLLALSFLLWLCLVSETAAGCSLVGGSKLTWRISSGESSAQPVARSCHATAIADKRIWMFGGRTDSSLLNDLHAFHTEQQWWDLDVVAGVRGKRPPPRDKHVMYNLGDKRLIVFGGKGKEGFFRKVAFNDLHIFDLRSLHWTNVEARNAPSAREGAAIVAVEKKVYLFGGSSGDTTYFNDLYELDMKSMVWKEVMTTGKPPPPRAGHSLTLTDDKTACVVYGGRYKNEYFNDVFVLQFTPNPPRWSKIDIDASSLDGPLPSPRYGHTLVAFHEEFLLFGGHTKLPTREENLFVLTLNKEDKSGKWHTVQADGDIPESRYYHSMDAIYNDESNSGNFFLFGGYNGNKANNDMHVLDVECPEETVLPPVKVSTILKVLLTLSIGVGLYWCLFHRKPSSPLVHQAQLVSKPTTTPQPLVRQSEQRGWGSTLGWLLRGCLPSLRSPLTVLLLFFYLSLLVTFIFFSLFVMDAYHVVASSRANRVKAEMQNIRNEQEIARKLYDRECVWDNVDWYRKPAAFFRFTRTSDGHLVGDTRCQEYLRVINTDPELAVSPVQVCTKDIAEALRIIMIKFSEGLAQSIDIFLRNLSLSAKAQLMIMFFPETCMKLMGGLFNVAVGIVRGVFCV